MNGGAVALGASRDRPAVGIKPFEVWQQRGMNVQEAPAPARDKPRRQNAHEAGETYDLDSMHAQRFVKRSLKRFAVFAELAVIDQRRRNALFAGVGETGGVGPVRNDKRNF